MATSYVNPKSVSQLKTITYNTQVLNNFPYPILLTASAVTSTHNEHEVNNRSLLNGCLIIIIY